MLSYKTRSCWKGLFFFKNLNNNRNIQVSKKLLKKHIFIYNGKIAKRIVFLKKNLMTKMGQYVITKKIGFQIHLQKKKKKKNNK